MRYHLTTDDHRLIAKWMRRNSPKRAPVGAASPDLRKAHKPRPKIVALEPGAGNWYVVKVAPKGEQKAADDLREAGFEVYKPQFKEERLNRRLRVKVVSTLLLFPRYLFVRMEPRHIAVARDCGSTIDVLPGFPHEPQPVKASIIDRLRQAEANGDLDDTDAARRKRGETTKNTLAAMRKRLVDKRVRIVDHAFYGFPATVEAVHSFTRLQVLVDIFGRPTPVELEIGQIEEAA